MFQRIFATIPVLVACGSEEIVLAPSIATTGTAVMFATPEGSADAELWVVDLATGEGSECHPRVDLTTESIRALAFDETPESLCLTTGCLVESAEGEFTTRGTAFELQMSGTVARWTELSEKPPRLASLKLPPCLAAPSHPKKLALGATHSCALLESGDVYCWGDGRKGQLGTPFINERSPVRVPLPGPADDLDSGKDFSCARLGAELYCWGDNSLGQISDGPSFFDHPTLARTSTQPVSSFAIGDAHVCAAISDGSTFCFGSNERGQLGIDDPSRKTHHLVLAPRLLAMGSRHSLAVLETGELVGWGENDFGQLGDGTQLDRPRVVDSHFEGPIDAISAGELHSCLLSNGRVKCVGYNGQGQVDGLDGTSKYEWVDLRAARDVASIDAGARNTCWTSNGTLVCVGVASFDFQSLFELKKVEHVSVGYLSDGSGEITSMCASSADGSIRCAGVNSNGQLGDGTNTSREAPVPVRWTR